MKTQEKRQGPKDLNTIQKKVQWLMRKAPETCTDQTLLLLAYWQVFDEIEFPPELLKQIAEKATPPESISRSRRFAVKNHEMLLDIIKAIMNSR